MLFLRYGSLNRWYSCKYLKLNWGLRQMTGIVNTQIWRLGLFWKWESVGVHGAKAWRVMWSVEHRRWEYEMKDGGGLWRWWWGNYGYGMTMNTCDDDGSDGWVFQSFNLPTYDQAFPNPHAPFLRLSTSHLKILYSFTKLIKDIVFDIDHRYIVIKQTYVKNEYNMWYLGGWWVINRWWKCK